MSAEIIYKTALEQLAANGCDEAKTALQFGKVCVTPDYRAVINNLVDLLTDADMELKSALRANEDEWCTETDTHIDRARSMILEAIALFARK